MKKLLFILTLMVTVTTINFAQTSVSSVCDLASVIQVDGPSNEWPMDWIKDDDKIFSYNVCHDDNNIYIRVKTSDEITKRKIAHFGFTVWMDPKGKRKKKLGLRFPTGVEANERMDRFRASGLDKKELTTPERDSLQKKMNREFITDVQILELLGLTDEPLTSSRAGITNGLKVGIAPESDGSYVYEALIPFKSFRLSKASIATLGIGFETGKFTPPPQKIANTVPTGGAGSNRGGYGGGGYGGGGYGGGGFGGSSGRNRNLGGSGYRTTPMMTATSAWTTLKLK